MHRPFLILLVLVGGFLSGCASTHQNEDPNHVSTIPWNRPERWEGQGPMGGMMNSR